MARRVGKTSRQLSRQTGRWAGREAGMEIYRQTHLHSQPDEAKTTLGCFRVNSFAMSFNRIIGRNNFVYGTLGVVWGSVARC